MDAPASIPSPQALAQFLEALEQKITSERASFAERSFSMGCNALIVPMLIILVIFYFLGVRSWAGLAIILIVEGVATFMLAALFSTRSQSAAGRRFFEQTALPEIRVYAAEHQLTMEQVIAAAANTLPQEAQLPHLLKTSGAIK